MTNFLLKDTYTSLIEYPVINNTKILNTKKNNKNKILKICANNYVSRQKGATSAAWVGQEWKRENSC